MSEEKARKIIANYIEAFNAQDLNAMLDCFNFPFCWITNDIMIPVQEASEFRSPTKALIEQEGTYKDHKAHYR